MGNNTGDNISAVLGLDGLGEIDESGLPEAGSDEANEGFDLEASYDLNEPPDDKNVEPDTEGQPQGRKQLVPLGALQEERTKRQELQSRLEEEQRVKDQMQMRFNEMMMRLQGVQKDPPAVEEDVIPDFHEDPAAHVAALTKQFERRMGEMQQFVQQQQGQTAQNQQVQQLAQQATADEARFRATAPDYDQAADHFRAVKLAEYEALGLDAVAAQQQLAKDCTRLVQLATQQKRSPAEALYKLAKALGYFAQAPQQRQQGQPPAQQQRAKAPTSLANVSGAPKAPDEDHGGAMSLEKIAHMSDKDFDKFFSDMGKGSVQRPKF